MLAALLALPGALVYGAADFLGGLAAQRLRSLVVTAVSALSGLALLVVAAPFFPTAWRPVDLAWGALAGVTCVVAITLLYACLAIGPMSILSPLTAVVSAVAPMLWGLLVDGEVLSVVGYAGLGVALVAVVLVGFIPGETVARPSPRGLAMAIGAGLMIGAFLIVIDQTGDESGLIPLVVTRSVNAVLSSAIAGAAALALVRAGRPAASVLSTPGRVPEADPPRPPGFEPAAAPATVSLSRAWWLAIGCGVLDAGANVMLLAALRSGDLAIVSALTALYPAGTILLAAVILRERIALVQGIGLALALSAGAMLAVS